MDLSAENRPEILCKVVHLKIGQGLALIKVRWQLLVQPSPTFPSSADEEDQMPDAMRLGQGLVLPKARPQMALPSFKPPSPSFADEESVSRLPRQRPSR
jgi:hypothetical protein